LNHDQRCWEKVEFIGNHRRVTMVELRVKTMTNVSNMIPIQSICWERYGDWFCFWGVEFLQCTYTTRRVLGISVSISSVNNMINLNIYLIMWRITMTVSLLGIVKIRRWTILQDIRKQTWRFYALVQSCKKNLSYTQFKVVTCYTDAICDARLLYY
jgi:hypothetical protein